MTGIDFYGVTRSQTPQRRRKEGGNGGGGFGLRAPWTVRCGGVALRTFLKRPKWVHKQSNPFSRVAFVPCNIREGVGIAYLQAEEKEKGCRDAAILLATSHLEPHFSLSLSPASSRSGVDELTPGAEGHPHPPARGRGRRWWCNSISIVYKSLTKRNEERCWTIVRA